MAELTVQVDASEDDCVRRLTTSYFDLVDVYERVGRDHTTLKQWGCGMRFDNVTIPKGSTILTAHLTVQSAIPGSNTTVNTRISAEDVDDALAFADDAAAFDTRYAARTTAIVDWDNIESFDPAGNDHDSPDITAVIQEIVDRGGWVSGQAIVIFWEDFDDRTTGVPESIARYAKSFDHADGAANAPKLVITYTEPPTGMKGLNPALMEVMGYS